MRDGPVIVIHKGRPLGMGGVAADCSGAAHYPPSVYEHKDVPRVMCEGCLMVAAGWRRP